jgi:hypothetical protein
MTIVLAALLGVLLLHGPRKWFATVKASRNVPTRCPPKSRLRLLLSRGCFTIMLLLYPVVTNAVMKLMDCQSVSMNQTAYESLDGSYPSAKQTDAPVNVNIMTTNPQYVCYEGSHAPAGFMAWVTLLLYVVGYPVGSFVYVKRRIGKLVSKELSMQTVVSLPIRRFSALTGSEKIDHRRACWRIQRSHPSLPLTIVHLCFGLGMWIWRRCWCYH